MAEGTKRPGGTEPPRQGGGFVTGGDDAWTQQDPDTWAKMGTPNATPLRPADERRREATDGGNGKHPPRPPRSVISGPPSRPPAPSPDIAKMFGGGRGGDDPSTVVGSVKKTPSAPKPGVARIDGARMEIVNFDGVGSRVPGGPASLHDDGTPQPSPSRLDQLFPGYPPIRIVRRPRKEAAAGRVLLSVSVVVALGALAWNRYDRYLEANMPSPNKVIYTKLDGAEEASAGEGEGSGPPAGAPVGTLTVTSNRSATVYVDGRAAGSVPIDNVRIVMGMHEIKVVDEKTLESRTQKVKINAGQPKIVSISF